MGLTMGKAFQSNFLSKDDCPTTATINKVDFEMVGGEDTGKERKVVIHSTDFPMLPDNTHKMFILNKSNWINIEDAYGPDTDTWIGQRIELYVDPSIMYGGKRVGGVRVRIPGGQAQAAPGFALPPMAPVGKIWSWQQACEAAVAAGISIDQLKAELKSMGLSGYVSTPAATTAAQTAIANLTVQPAASFDANATPDDNIPFS